jgi:sporulation protein YlmC with PRC-barrel domain
MGGFGMNAKKLKGMKVLDKNGVEIGNVSDLGIDCDEFKIRNILVSTGGFFSKKYFIVDAGQLAGIDNIMHLKSSKEEQMPAVSLKKLAISGDYFFKNFRYRVVRSDNSNFFGVVGDITFNLNNSLLFNAVVEQVPDGRFGRTYFNASLEDFSKVAIVMTLNLGDNEIKERIN